MADERVIKIRLDGSSAKIEAASTNRSIKGIGTSADKSSKSLLNMKTAVIAVAAALASSRIIQYADAWTSVNNQIKQATKTTTEALAVQEAIFNIAKESRVELQGVADAYQRISNSVADYGFSAKDSLDVVEGLTKAFKANGASAQEVSSVLVQLGQGLGSGALQGEELKAILEASLPVSRALANEFGVAVGQLKDLGAAGKLNTERVFKALQNALPEFESSFDKASKTIAEGFTVAGNSITRLAGLTSEATGASETLANGLIDLSNAIDFLGDAVASGAASKIAEVFQSQLQLIANDVTTTVNYIFDSWETMSGGIQASSTKTGEFIGDAFLNIIPNIRTMIQVLTVELASGIDKLAAYGKAVEDTLNPFDDVSVNQARGFFGRQIKQIDEVRDASIQSIFNQREVEKQAQNERIAEAEVLIQKYKEQRDARSLSLETGEIGAGTPNQPVSESASSPVENNGDNGDLTAKLQRENQMISDSLLARQGIYSQYYEDANNLQLSDYERSNAQLLMQIELQKQAEAEAFQQQLQAITDRQLAIDDNKSLNDEQKVEAKALLDEQAIIAEQVFQNRLTEITADGNAQREQLELSSFNSRISAWTGFASSTLSLLGSFGNQSFKTQKKFAIAESIVNIAGGVAKALNNPYPANLGFAAQVAAQGAGLIATIKSSNPNTSSSNVGGLSTASTTSSAASTASDTSSQTSTRIVDIRGIENGASVTLTKEELANLLTNDDDIIMSVNNGQTQATRTGLI